MFAWWRTAGVEQAVFQLREFCAPLGEAMPRWVLFSLPDGLWAYAMTAFMAQLWLKSEPSLSRTIWLSAGLVLSVGSELGQLTGYVPGSFDAADLLIALLGSLLALAVARAMAVTTQTINGALTQ